MESPPETCLAETLPSTGAQIVFTQVLTMCVKIKSDDSFLFAKKSADDETHKHKHINIIRIIVKTQDTPNSKENLNT